MFHKQEARCSAIILAAGNSNRMQGIDKMMVEIGAVPVLARSIAAFQNCGQISEIIVVARKDLLEEIGKLCVSCRFDKVTKIVVGGADRSHSVQNGLNEVNNNTDLIAIHDGARPFVSQKILEETIEAARKTGAAAPAVPVNDTIKSAVDSVVTSTPDRSHLFAVQTPQIFDADFIRGALYHCISNQIPLTDDCSAVEQIGKAVYLTKGDAKILRLQHNLIL